MHFLPKKHCFYPKRHFLWPKISKKKCVNRDKSSNFRPSPNFSAGATRASVQLLPPCRRPTSSCLCHLPHFGINLRKKKTSKQSSYIQKGSLFQLCSPKVACLQSNKMQNITPAPEFALEMLVSSIHRGLLCRQQRISDIKRKKTCTYHKTRCALHMDELQICKSSLSVFFFCH